MQLDFVASKMPACLENCVSLYRGFKKQRLPWRGPLDLEQNCDCTSCNTAGRWLAIIYNNARNTCVFRAAD